MIKWLFHGVDNFDKYIHKARAILILMVHALYFEIAKKGCDIVIKARSTFHVNFQFILSGSVCFAVFVTTSSG